MRQIAVHEDVRVGEPAVQHEMESLGTPECEFFFVFLGGPLPWLMAVLVFGKTGKNVLGHGFGLEGDGGNYNKVGDGEVKFVTGDVVFRVVHGVDRRDLVFGRVGDVFSGAVAYVGFIIITGFG